MTTADYRRLMANGATGASRAPDRASEGVAITGSRITLAQYHASLSGKMPPGIGVIQPGLQANNGKASKREIKALADLAGIPQKKKSRVTRVIDSIKNAMPEGAGTTGERIEIHWPGMTLLTLNEMLRIDHRCMHAYRRACHTAVTNAVVALSSRTHGLSFDRPVRLQIRRTGKKLVDTDGLYASFKFVIDGFRLAGVIRDDDPLTITGMDHVQTIGEPSISVLITVQPN